MDAKPIPAFYCCYLLRSTMRHASLYIGSTPNPKRRLAQHNGISKGGARRTATLSLRPWEMTCIVTGFPSRIAALQFEWAWKNSHLTRNIPEEQRITPRIVRTSIRRAGHSRKQVKRPTLSLKNEISNLHLLLRVPGFTRWPLGVRFFCEDVYQQWLKFAPAAEAPLREGIDVIRDFKTQGVSKLKDAAKKYSSGAKSVEQATVKNAVEALDVSYLPLKRHVDIGQTLEQDSAPLRCGCCDRLVDPKSDMVVVCPEESCKVLSHMACLSQRFLESDPGQELLPVQGTCPSCGTKLKWVDLVKELTLRMRSEKELERLAKLAKRAANARAGSNSVSSDEEDDEENFSADEDYEDDEMDAEDVAEEQNISSSSRPHATVVQDSDDWEGIEVLQ